jgi:type II secretory pathway component PulF
MPRFKYTALNLEGVKVTGIEECASRGSLTAQLEDKCLLLIKAREAGQRTAEKRERGRFASKIPVDDLILFTRQFATMFRVGVPLLRILYILKDQVENAGLQMVVAKIAKDVEAGSSLADAFRKHPRLFPSIYCSMLAAGETSGNIAEVMEKLCESMEYEAEVKNLIKGALQYPIIVLIALVIAFAVLMGFVIPAFIPLFDQLGGELPPLTQVCIAISALFTDYWPILLGLVLSAITAIVVARRHEQGRLALAKFVLNIPLVGPLMTYSFMARFGSLFAILQSSGILIVDALHIVCECINNRAIQEEITRCSYDVEAGKSIASSLHSARYFPKIMQSMIAIGEASGNLEEMMNEATRHFEVEVHHAVKRLTGALGPILIVNMAIAVGFFAMAIYLPIWEMTELQMQQ